MVPFVVLRNFLSNSSLYMFWKTVVYTICILFITGQESEIIRESICHHSWVCDSLYRIRRFRATHLAVLELWPQTTVRGCRFHLGQCWWRYIQKSHLAEIYKDKENGDSTALKYVFGLPFFRRNNVEDGFSALMEIKPATKEMDDFFDYLLENYLTEDSLFSTFLVNRHEFYVAENDQLLWGVPQQVQCWIQFIKAEYTVQYTLLLIF